MDIRLPGQCHSIGGTHEPGKGPRSQCGWRSAQPHCALYSVVLYNVVKVSLIFYKKTDFQLLLKNQKTWQNGPEFLSCGHLGEDLLPLD